ncbi:hypothetical protein GCM10028826_19590 [Mucilaginibacter boryungensis]
MGFIIIEFVTTTGTNVVGLSDDLLQPVTAKTADTSNTKYTRKFCRVNFIVAKYDKNFKITVLPAKILTCSDILTQFNNKAKTS